MSYLGSKIPFEVDLDLYLNNPMLWQDFEERISGASEGIKLVLINTATALYLMDLGVDLNLSDEQLSNIARIIRDIALGKEYLGDMTALLQERLVIDQMLAQTVSNRLLNELLKPAMEDIKQVQLKYFQNRIASKATPIGTTKNILNLRKPS